MVEEMISSMFPTYPCIGYLSAFHNLSQQGNYTSTLKQFNSLQELFEGKTESSHILVEGHAGIGKTTLCKEICYQWGENNFFTPDELVLLLLLQDPNAQKITSELQLAEYFGISSDHIELFLEYLEYSCGAKVTIIIDSYDELSCELQDDCFFKDLVERKRLSKARIIITSRPSASYHLYNYVDRKVELFELTQSAKSEVISLALKDHPYELKMLRDHLCQYLDMAKLTSIPIYLTVIVWLCLQKSLPCTATEMQENFILYALNHHLKVTGVVTDFIETEQLMNFVDLNKLERFAFESLIRGKSTFLELPNDIDDTMGYGLMHITECYNSSLFHRHSVQSLKFYPGMQEYLAAKYVAGLSIEIVVEIFQTVASMPASIDLRMQLFDMWVFVFSTISKPIRRILFFEVLLSFDLVEDMDSPSNQEYTGINNKSTVLNKTDKAYLNILSLLQFFQGLDEFENILYQEFGDGSIVDFAYRNLLPYHIVALGLLLSKYLATENIKLLNLTGCYIGDYGLHMLHKYLCTSNQQVNVLNLNLGDNNLTAASSSLISDIVSFIKPHSLELSCNYLMDAGIADVCTAIVKNESIKDLYLAENEISSVGSMLLSDIMMHIRTLDISYNDICDDGAEVLSQGLIRSVTLIQLIMRYCNIGEVGACELAQALTTNSSLEILWMNGNAIGHSGAGDIAAALCVNNTLKELSLADNSTIDYAAASEILESLHQNTSLTNLDLPADLDVSSKDLLNLKVDNINASRSKSDHEQLIVLFCDDIHGYY